MQCSKLITILSDENFQVRELAVWALSEVKDARAVTALCSVLLSDTRVEVRRGAAEALGEIQSAAALPALRQAINDSEPGVSAKAAWAISEIDARTPISNAEEYRKGFSNSTHMIIEGAVHSDPLFLSSPKIKEGMMEFLRGQPVTATKIQLKRLKFVL